jgi:hypothetical protein
LLKAVDRTPIVALGRIGEAEIAVRKRVQDAIVVSRDEREGVLGGGDGLIMRALEPEKM